MGIYARAKGARARLKIFTRSANLTDNTRCRKTDARRDWRDKMRLLAAGIKLPPRADGGSYRLRPTRIFVI